MFRLVVQHRHRRWRRLVCAVRQRDPNQLVMLGEYVVIILGSATTMHTAGRVKKSLFQINVSAVGTLCSTHIIYHIQVCASELRVSNRLVILDQLFLVTSARAVRMHKAGYV